MKTIAFLVVVSLAFAAGRVWPGFPSRPASAWGTYEAFAHCWAAALFVVPIAYWIIWSRADRLADSVVHSSERRASLDVVEKTFRPANIAAVVSICLSVWLTLGVEGVMFFLQVPYPWHR